MALSAVGLKAHKRAFIDSVREICSPGLVHQQPFRNVVKL